MRPDKISILIKNLALEFDKLAIPELTTYDLTPSQYKIIKYLMYNDGTDVRQRDIEKAFSMTNPTVTGILQNLEKSGWIERIENENDARSKVIKLTKKSLNRKDELYEIGESLESKFTCGLSKEEKKELKILLKKMINSLEKKNK